MWSQSLLHYISNNKKRVLLQLLNASQVRELFLMNARGAVFYLVFYEDIDPL